MPPLRAASDKLLHLDLLRFVASVGIVYHHSHEFLIDPQMRAAAIARSSGLALFVDLFFVISGFVIAYIYIDQIGGWANFVRFMQRRVGRLVPLHWLTLALSILLFWLFLLAGAVPKHMPSFRPECIADTAFLLHAVVPCGEFGFNGVTWSISAEMAMYLAFPFFAVLAKRWRAAPLIIAGLILGGIAARERAAGDLLSYDWEQVHALLRALPAFLFGIALYQYRTTLRRMHAAPVFLACSLLGLIGAMSEGAPECLTLGLVYTTATFAVAADMQGCATGFVKKLAPLGQLTYSIYMWHMLFIDLILNALADKFLHLAGPPMVLCVCMCYSSILICSYASFFLVETPARRWIDGLSLTPSRKIATYRREPV